jgi:hypothetical protein
MRYTPWNAEEEEEARVESYSFILFAESKRTEAEGGG